MAIYNAKDGHGLQILGYDVQYSDCIIYRETRKEILDLANKLVSKVSANKHELFEELNNMQAEAGDCHAFENKYTIPTYFINLILSRYGFKLLGD